MLYISVTMYIIFDAIFELDMSYFLCFGSNYSNLLLILTVRFIFMPVMLSFFPNSMDILGIT
jgi:hypothetical protein